jgi:predicted negative regulator of RcsB-dependent stress response
MDKNLKGIIAISVLGLVGFLGYKYLSKKGILGSAKSIANDNFALLSSVALYNKPFPVKLRNDIIKIFNERPDNIYGKNIRFLLSHI